MLQRKARKLISVILLVCMVVLMLPVGITNAALAGDTLGSGEVGVIMDDLAQGVTRTGTVITGIASAAAYSLGGTFSYADINKSAPQSITFPVQVPEDGLYEFYVRKVGSKWFGANVPYTINYEGNSDVVNITPCADSKEEWVKLGAPYTFKAGNNYTVVAGGSGYNTFPLSDVKQIIVDGIKLIKVSELPNDEDIAALEAEMAKYETSAVIDESVTAQEIVTDRILKLKPDVTTASSIEITPKSPTNGTYLGVSEGEFILKSQNTSGTDYIENTEFTFKKGSMTRTLTVTVTIDSQAVVPDDIQVAQEAAKYETVAVVGSEVAAGADVLNAILRLKAGNTTNSAITLSLVTPAGNTYVTAANGTVTLNTLNATSTNITEPVDVIFTKGSASTTLTIPVTVVPQTTLDPQTENYFTDAGTLYRNFAPGIINPNEGTVELTMRIDKPYSDFGDNWDMPFTLVPAQTGPGNNLINVNIPPMLSKTTSSTGFEQPLTFFVRNGEGTSGAYATAQPSALNYEVGKPFNMAFVWKMGTGGYVAIYMNGVQIGYSNTSLASVMEKYMPYEFRVERAAPFNISNVKISTKALNADQLEKGTGGFSRDTDTALLAQVTFGTQPQTQRFVTPWQISSDYSAVKPAFRLEKQASYSDETTVYPVMTVNYGDTDKDYTVSIKATDPYGNIAFTENKTVTVPADSKYRVSELALPQLDNKVGFWYIETTISSNTSNAIVYKSAISKLKRNDTSVADGNYADYYGQHLPESYDMSVWPKINTDTTRTWESGTVFLWRNIEPTDEHFTWDRSDKYVNSAITNNMDVLAVMGYPSNWASARPLFSEIPAGGYGNSYQYRAERWVSKDIKFTDGQPGSGDQWSNYIYQTMKRYAGKVKYYEIVNEVNFHPPYLPASFSGTEEEYFLMLKLAYEQAQKVKQEYKAETGNDLELYVVTSGFTSVSGTVGDRQMVLDALSAENIQYYDIFNIHGYDGTKGITNILDAYTAAKQLKPSLQLWQGEVYPVNVTAIPTRIYNIVENYLDFMSVGTSKYFNMGTPGEDTFFVAASQAPTEVFQTMATLQNNIRKVDQYIGSYTGFTNANALTVNHYMRRTDGNYLSIFSTNSLKLYLNIKNADKIISVEDNYGNSVPVTETNGIGTIEKISSVFVVSSEPLDIDSVTGNVSLDIIKNGGFENTSGDPMGGAASFTPTEWLMGYGVGTYGTNAYLNTTAPYEGSKALEFNSAGAPNNRTFMYEKFTITQPGTYMLSAYIKKLEGTDVQPELNIWDGTSDHQLAPVTLTSNYKYYAKTFEVTKAMDLVVNIGILSGTGKIVMDNVKFDLVPENVEIIMDNSDATGVEFTGSSWDNTRTNAGAYNGNYALNTTKGGNAQVRYTPVIPLAGYYDVYVWQHTTTAASDVPFTINHADGSNTVTVDQSKNGSTWFKIGNYPFSAGTAGNVVITNSYVQGNFMLADGIRFVRTGPIETNVPSTDSNLQNLTPAGITLAPAFSSDVTNYSADVANSVNSTTVSAIAADSKATVTINGEAVSSKAINLNEGSNTITVVVTAEDGITKKTYTITITRAALSGTGTGSGGTGNSDNYTITTSTQPDRGNTSQITAETAAAAQVNSGGVAVATVPAAQVTAAVNKVLEAVAGQEGKTTASVKINVTAQTEANSVQTVLTKDSISLLADKDVSGLTIATPLAQVTFDDKAIDTIAKAGGEVRIIAAKVDKEALSDDVITRVQDKEVYNFSVTSGETAISKFVGQVTVSVPYTLKEGESKNSIVIYYINAESKLEVVKNCKYDEATGMVTFKTNHFSQYAVGHVNVSFTDVSNTWYSDAVEFAAARDITAGTGNGKFNPEADLTRSQFLILLLKAYGVNPQTSSSDNFADAGDTYYTGYLAAAKKLGITSGTGNNRFEPEKKITRQEMCTLLYNALKVTGELTDIANVDSLSTYKDAEKVSAWAQQAMSQLAAAGIISGSNGEIDPEGTATRAQMVQILYNLMTK